MALTAAQQAALKADILADATLNAYPDNSDGAFAIAAAYSEPASPDFWVWRTAVTREDITDKASVDGTTWSWPSFIARSGGEQAGWSEILAGGTVNASLPNVRQAFADIFSGGASSAPQQRAHLLAVARRLATRAEKLFATGTGSTGSPGTMTLEGNLSYQDVLEARRS